jgi:FdhE protein
LADAALGEEEWLRSHSYLEPLARFRAEVAAAMATVAPTTEPAPDWSLYRGDYHAGVPLLRSPGVEIGRASADEWIAAVVESLPMAGALRAQVRGRPVVAWLLGDAELEVSSPGLLRFLGWTALARHLRPILDAYAAWRDEDRWMRPYCPSCGSLPAMAHLLATETGRHRFLACGCCGTRWRYRRTECPFCEADPQRLPVVAIEGEAGLRIDYCETCRAYLKTYDGHGSEALLLADWTSLHLDVVARERGLVRAAESLYELPPR